MANTDALWTLLLEAAQPQAAAALKDEVETAPDARLSRINALAFASARGLDEDETVGALVRAANLGLFDMTWSALCPGCGGVLETTAALKTLDRSEYFCSLCAIELRDDARRPCRGDVHRQPARAPHRRPRS